MNILDIAIAKKLAGGGGGSGTDNYNDLSNLPKINDTTLSGNKSSSALGLQSEINSESKLASDLVDDTNQDNKFVTSTEKNTWNAKQNAIDADHKLSSDLVDDANKTNKFVTSTEKNTWNAKQNAIDSDHKLSSDLVDDANKTNKFVTSTEKNTWNAKQNAIDADHKLSSSLVSFTTAEAAALASGIDSSKVGQISTNQTNILYSLNKGAKNSLVFTNGTTDFTGITYTRNTDDSVTVSGSNTASSRAVYSITSGNESEKAGHYIPNNHVGEIFSIGDVVSDNSCYAIIFYSNNGSTWANEETLRGTSAVHTTIKDYPYYNICICILEGTTISPVRTFYPMICPQSVYNTDPSYQPPSLPNYDLTRLQAEDRAGLVECVDGGAKNKIQIISPTTTIGNITFTVNSDGSITVNGSANTTDTFYYLNAANGTSGYINFNTGKAPCFLTGCPSGGATDTYELQISSLSGDFRDRGAGVDVPANITGSPVIAIRKNYAPSNLKFYPMLCTKAAFGVSQKFVPYRYDPYTTVRQNLANATLYARRNGRTVTINGYVDNLSFTSGTALTLGTINDEIGKPVQQIRALCNIGSNAYSIGDVSYLTVGTDGQLKVTPKTYSGTGAVFLSFAYAF